MAEQMTFEKAQEILGQGFHCSQCVMMHVAERLGMDENQALKLSAGLGGGCFHGEICGAVSGGVLALGLVYGFDQPEARKENELMVEKIHEFEDRFKELHETVVCRELLGGWDFGKPDEAAKIMGENLVRNCPEYCADVCDILDDMLQDYLK